MRVFRDGAWFGTTLVPQLQIQRRRVGRLLCAARAHGRGAAETERRTDELIDTLEGRRPAIREKVRETKG